MGWLPRAALFVGSDGRVFLRGESHCGGARRARFEPRSGRQDIVPRTEVPAAWRTAWCPGVICRESIRHSGSMAKYEASDPQINGLSGLRARDIGAVDADLKAGVRDFWLLSRCVYAGCARGGPAGFIFL